MKASSMIEFLGIRIPMSILYSVILFALIISMLINMMQKKTH